MVDRDDGLKFSQLVQGHHIPNFEVHNMKDRLSVEQDHPGFLLQKESQSGRAESSKPKIVF